MDKREAAASLFFSDNGKTATGFPAAFSVCSSYRGVSIQCQKSEYIRRAILR